MAFVCAIALQEHRYIDDWIRYHLGIGFDGIQVYDNSADNSLAGLQATYPGKVFVLHHPVKNGSQQRLAYEDFGKRLGQDRQAKWAAFIDVDEYIVLNRHADIKEFLQEHCQSGSVSLNWYMYGSNGHREFEPIPVVQRFTRRSAKLDRHVKSIVHIPDYGSYRDPHSFSTRPGTHQRDPSGRAINGPFNPGGSDAIAHINHYNCKSKAEFAEKVARGRADTTQKRSMDEFAAFDCNDVEDTRALIAFQRIIDGLT